ncbi:porin family protein [Hymenobacter norwichensis]|uniref:porin family protein n=1 Tax=Hymenobacter norwichensis TaxID=223903 RepID=UPI0003B5861D|nr:porin family protein [Hymenobacter norwichensis]
MRLTYTLALLCSLLAAKAGHAQQVRVGVKAGLNASTYAGANLPDTKYRLGPAAGVLLQIPVGSHVDLQPELLYEQRGAHITYIRELGNGNPPVITYTRTTRSRLHYASLPILVRIHQGKWFALAGPQLSYLLAEKRTNQEDITVAYPTIDFFPVEATPMPRSIKDYRQVELGYVLGIGYEITPRWRVEGRYTAGATKVRQPSVELHDADYGPERLEKARNSSLQLQVSYLLSSL